MFGIFKSKDKEKEKVVENKRPSKIKLDETTDFEEVERFDTDKHVSDLFHEVFMAVQYDGWKTDVQSYGEIHFAKDSVTLKIFYGDYKSFRIKKIELSNGRWSTYTFTEDLEESVYAFFYGVYRDHFTAANEKAERELEGNIASIRKALGKEVLRDAKIDSLLNDDDE